MYEQLELTMQIHKIMLKLGSQKKKDCLTVNEDSLVRQTTQLLKGDNTIQFR